MFGKGLLHRTRFGGDRWREGGFTMYDGTARSSGTAVLLPVEGTREMFVFLLVPEVRLLPLHLGSHWLKT